ncbi:MAG: hypothetical protein EOO40_02630 [Deltaproteobacteria bacterium]|nr:MAG: hypothetical protein EOO40_02630 [Deltaproteobacteria bacterium]
MISKFTAPANLEHHAPLLPSADSAQPGSPTDLEQGSFDGSPNSRISASGEPPRTWGVLAAPAAVSRRGFELVRQVRHHPATHAAGKGATFYANIGLSAYLRSVVSSYSHILPSVVRETAYELARTAALLIPAEQLIHGLARSMDAALPPGSRWTYRFPEKLSDMMAYVVGIAEHAPRGQAGFSQEMSHLSWQLTRRPRDPFPLYEHCTSRGLIIMPIPHGCPDPAYNDMARSLDPISYGVNYYLVGATLGASIGLAMYQAPQVRRCVDEYITCVGEKIADVFDAKFLKPYREHMRSPALVPADMATQPQDDEAALDDESQAASSSEASEVA